MRRAALDGLLLPSILVLSLFIADTARAQAIGMNEPASATEQAPIAPPAAATQPEQPKPEAAVPVPASSLATAILAEISARTASMRDPKEKEWLAQLETTYRERGGEPLWVDRHGALPSAEVAREELGRANEWGLDRSKLGIPDAVPQGANEAALATAEIRLSLAVAKYAAHARGHRVDPSELSQWLDIKPNPINVGVLTKGVASSADSAGALRRLHPQHEEFERLRQAYLVTLGGQKQPAAEPELPTVPSGPKLRPGSTHPDIAALRKRLGVPADDGTASEYYDDKLAVALRKFLREKGRSVTSTLNEQTRAAVNGQTAKKDREPKDERALQRKLLVNMERWRWMPENLGSLYIWNNLPEFETRVIRSGEIIHQERIIIGKPEQQTPVFSDTMRFVVFQPEWGVPPSIKVKDLLPKLQSGDHDALERRNMRIVINGKAKDPGYYDWSRTDIRKIPIVQYAGDENPLGEMKFMFPNKHDVYMHDTPSKNLFNASVRTFSSGCIRVRNPRKLADLVFNLDRSWTPTQVGEVLWGREANKRVDLEKRIPVHMTYFTIRIDQSGRLASLADVYGHDKRIQQALDGRPVRDIAAEDPALRHAERVEELASRPAQPARFMSDPYGRNPYGTYGYGYGYSNQQRRYQGGGGGGFLGGIFGF